MMRGKRLYASRTTFVLKNVIGEVKFNAPPTPYLVYWGFDGHGTAGVHAPNSMVIISRGGCLEFSGAAHICKGTAIRIDKGTVRIGGGFYANKNLFIRCDETVSFGDNCLLGWNVSINTTNGHTIIYDGKEKRPSGSVRIGSRVWIASNVSVCKNVEIADGCVVAQNSLVTKSVSESGTLIGGVPAKPIRRDVGWRL